MYVQPSRPGVRPSILPRCRSLMGQRIARRQADVPGGGLSLAESGGLVHVASLFFLAAAEISTDLNTCCGQLMSRGQP